MDVWGVASGTRSMGIQFSQEPGAKGVGLVLLRPPGDALWCVAGALAEPAHGPVMGTWGRRWSEPLPRFPTPAGKSCRTPCPRPACGRPEAVSPGVPLPCQLRVDGVVTALNLAPASVALPWNTRGLCSLAVRLGGLVTAPTSAHSGGDTV